MRVEKALNGEVEVQQEQSAVADETSLKKPDAWTTTAEERPRQRHLELWLGAAYESIRSLVKSYQSMSSSLEHDKEVQAGMSLMQRITQDAGDALEPMVQKYGTDLKYGHEISEALRKSLFPEGNTPLDPYGILLTLTGLLTYMANVEAHLSALAPVSQALWDEAFIKAVSDANSCMARTQKWTKHQLAVRSPQTLVVPSADVITSEMQWTG